MYGEGCYAHKIVIKFKIYAAIRMVLSEWVTFDK